METRSKILNLDFKCGRFEPGHQKDIRGGHGQWAVGKAIAPHHASNSSQFHTRVIPARLVPFGSLSPTLHNSDFEFVIKDFFKLGIENH